MATTLEKLKEEAKSLGLEFHHNIGEVKLLALIEEHKGGNSEDVGEKAVLAEKIESRVKSRAERHSDLRKEQTKLVRIVLHCNNPNKKDLKGDYFTVSNKLIGDYTKYIPFDNEEGFHIPQALLNTIRDKQCLQFRSGKNADGVEVQIPYQAREYNIEVLPQLTGKELKKLAAAQKARGSIG